MQVGAAYVAKCVRRILASLIFWITGACAYFRDRKLYSSSDQSATATSSPILSQCSAAGSKRTSVNALFVEPRKELCGAVELTHSTLGGQKVAFTAVMTLSISSCVIAGKSGKVSALS
jgi:hypothetical protein